MEIIFGFQKYSTVWEEYQNCIIKESAIFRDSSLCNRFLYGILLV